MTTEEEHISSQEQMRRALLKRKIPAQFRDNAQIELMFKLQTAVNNSTDACKDCRVNCCERCTVDFTSADISRLAQYLGLTASEFKEKYTIPHPKFKRFYRAKETPCIFLKNGGCSVYPARPTICATWPFLDLNAQDFAVRYAQLYNRPAISLPTGCNCAIQAAGSVIGIDYVKIIPSITVPQPIGQPSQQLIRMEG